MTPGRRGEPNRAELAAAADELFEAMYPEDLAELLAKFDSRPALRDAVVDRAERVVRHLAGGPQEVTSREYVRLIAATLTWGKGHAGVQRNTGHAAKKFSRYRRFPELPPEILVRTGRVDPDDDDRVIALLARSLRIRAGVAGVRSVGEPALILNAVIPAIVAALTAAPDDLVADPGADAALATTAVEVLERGAQLAAEYRASRRPTSGVELSLPVVGNADFLVRIAAYRLAIEQRRGLVASQVLDELQKAVAELAGILRQAVTRSASRWGWRGADEPDVAMAIDQFAVYLGSSAREPAAGRRVRKVNAVLSHRLRLDDAPDELFVEDPDREAAPLPQGPGPVERLSDVEHLTGWLVAALLRGAGSGAREPLLAWLNGARPADQAQDLPLLVRRLRVASKVLDNVPPLRPPRPAGVTPNQFQALATRLAANVDPDEINGCGKADARRVTLAALPPLWTRRWPAIQLITRQLAPRIVKDRSGRKAALVARHGVRAPVQFVQHSTSSLPVPCCQDAGTTGRPVQGRPREPVHYEEICPHRPWGEIGWVENFRSLGDATGFTAEAARRQLERYEGPWPELLWQ